MITAKEICARRNGSVVLNGITAEFERGKLIAVVGPNGAGKSTLLRVLAGIDQPIAGSVVIDGRRLDKFNPIELAQTVSYLPQDHHVSWPILVRDVVELGRMPYLSSLSRHTKQDIEHIERAIEAMDIGTIAHRPATTLSGGELARVLVARMLAQDTPVLIADEPAAGLDPAHALMLFQHFKTLADHGHLVLVAMHDLSLALRFCEQVVLLDRGKMAACGAARAVLTRANIAGAYGVDASIGDVDGVPVVLPLKVVTP